MRPALKPGLATASWARYVPFGHRYASRARSDEIATTTRPRCVRVPKISRSRPRRDRVEPPRPRVGERCPRCLPQPPLPAPDPRPVPPAPPPSRFAPVGGRNQLAPAWAPKPCPLRLPVLQPVPGLSLRLPPLPVLRPLQLHPAAPLVGRSQPVPGEGWARPVSGLAQPLLPRPSRAHPPPLRTRPAGSARCWRQPPWPPWSTRWLPP